ncbi:hypothetical protein FJZ36_04110 [Candidatus Poribacteria bacterium]|nr:hypothetical protein [Candidatus Poribacteria bacterium]
MDIERCWVSHPDEWQPLFRELHAAFRSRTALDAFEQFGGGQLLALTLLPAQEPAFRLLVMVPHGHEPAPTAAIVNAASQLLRGSFLDETPTSLPVNAILEQSLLTFVPDSNPQGRARSPYRCWDGTACDNETFWKHAFGIAADGKRFGRYPEWRQSEHEPRQIGVVYEQIADDLWVEPNTCRRSTHAHAMDALFERYRYTHMLDMHQHEWDECALLPAAFDSLDSRTQDELEAWSSRLIAAWRAMGVKPRPKASVPYRGGPRQALFLEFWAGRCPEMQVLGSEVRNNRYDPTGEPTPMERQFRSACAALEATLRLAYDPLP